MDTDVKPIDRAAAEHLQMFPTAVIAAAARGELDMNAMARAELAARGLDQQGEWVGFEAAKKLLTASAS